MQERSLFQLKFWISYGVDCLFALSRLDEVKCAFRSVSGQGDVRVTDNAGSDYSLVIKHMACGNKYSVSHVKRATDTPSAIRGLHFHEGNRRDVLQVQLSSSV